MSAPLVSVVIPTFNSAATLGATLQGLAEQSERDFEVIVSDGASRDGTLALVAAHVGALPHCATLSRPDRGVYDAINLGIAAARGQWVLVLGSDDRLHDAGTLRRIAPLLRASAAPVVYGDVRVLAQGVMGVAAGGRYAGPMPLARLLSANICQQAMFYRRELFGRLGGFDLRYPVLADWHFNLRVAFEAPLQWVDLVVADYAATGLSARIDDEGGLLGVLEWVRAELQRRRHEPATWPHQRVLLRYADRLRRRGHWGAALRQLGTWLALRAVRAMRIQ